MPKPKPALTTRSRYVPVLPILLACFAALSASSSALARIVEKVEVRGAQFIPAEDIRQTCGAEAGIEYLDIELRAIEECLMSTGVFETVELTRDDGTLFLDVEELDKRPGRVDVGVAYSPQDGVIGSLSFERYNLFDRTYGAVGVEYGPEIQQFRANLYRTEAFETELDLGFEIVGGRTDYDDLSYKEETFRAETYLAWSAISGLRVEGGIGYRDHSLYGLGDSASPLLVKEQTSGVAAPYARLGLKYTSSRALDEQTFGYSISLDQYFWNLGSNDPILDTRLEARAQIPVAQSLRLLVGVDAGRVYGSDGNATRAIDRNFLGGDTFRGFAPRGIGPRDSGDALGGNNYATASLELQHDVGMIYNSPLRAGVFWETGAVWGLDDRLGNKIDDGFHRRSSVGLSLTFDVGNTPVAIYIAEPIKKEYGDKTQIFGLTVSARF